MSTRYVVIAVLSASLMLTVSLNFARAVPKQSVLSKSEAARFLTQATFGPTIEGIYELTVNGYAAWLESQFEMTASSHVDHLTRMEGRKTQKTRIEVWWDIAINSPDQLRQRVAFALSEILVVSFRDAGLINYTFGLAHYYDQLVGHAFGNFRELIHDVTLSPIMGRYLSMLGNEGPDEARNIRPDENYARELMQLFSIGLVKLNIDGTPRLDERGAEIPTYDQDIIKGFAHVFTGWTYAYAQIWERPFPNVFQPMEPWEEFHASGEKRLLNGFVVPAGQSAREDLEQALDNVFNHPNVGPFIARRLIQRLVTSNPSPQYIARVATVFNHDSAGVRGNLGAVVKAVLLDDEARDGYLANLDTYGKLKEPLLRQSALWRAFNARSSTGRYQFYPFTEFAQAPLQSNSVFNFFEPDYSYPGTIANLGLVSPEFQITNETTITSVTNRLYSDIFFNHLSLEESDENTVLLDIEGVRALASEPVVLVDYLNLLLMNEQMSAELRDAVITLVQKIPLEEDGDHGTVRVLEAIYAIVVSPESAVQR